MEEEPAQRVNLLRLKDAVATGADLIVTACPFCLQMFEDAAKTFDPETPVEVADLVELLERAVTRPEMPAEPALAVKAGATESRGRVGIAGSG